MLRFTKEQEAFVLNHRRMHNKLHQEMQVRFGVNAANQASFQMNASPLPKDVWGEWDRDALVIQRDVLAVFNDLAATVSKSMPLGKLIHYFQQLGDNSEAHVSLDGRSKARKDAAERAYVGTPLPIIDSTYGFTWREMLAAQTEGVSLEDGNRQNAVRKVAEKLENISLYGDSQIVVSGQTLYGLANHPNRNTRSTGSTLASTTGANWKSEVIATLKLLHGDNYMGRPVTLYVNWSDWFYAGSTDYSTSYNSKTIAQAVREIEGVANVVASSKVPANTIIAVVKASDVVQVLNGMPIMTRPKARLNPEDDYDFIVMAAAAVELKYDANNNMGLAVSS